MNEGHAHPAERPSDAPRAPRTRAGAMMDAVSLCRVCDYDLTGLDAPGVCPECGTRFEELAGDELVTLAWPCLRCGYPLAGFRRNQKCSECGIPVRVSVDPGLLRFQSLEYRARLRRGSLLAGLGLVLLILAPAIAGIVAWILSRDELFGALMVVGYLSMAALFLIGWWMLLKPPPKSLGLSAKEARRWPIARWSLILWIATSVLAIGVGQALNAFYGSSALSVIAMFFLVALQVLAAVSSLTFFVLGLRVLRAVYVRARTARKRPGKIATCTLWFGVAVAGLYLASIAIIAGSSAIIGTRSSAGTMAGAGGLMFSMIPMSLSFVGAVIVYLLYIAAIDGVRSSVKRVNREILLAHKRASKPSQTSETPAPASPKNDTP